MVAVLALGMLAFSFFNATPEQKKKSWWFVAILVFLIVRAQWG